MPVFHGLEEPLASVEAFAQQLADEDLGLDGSEMAVERFDLTGKAAAFVALHHPGNLGKLGLIPLLPRFFFSGAGLWSGTQATIAPLFPVVHVEPLDMADVHRRLHLLLALDEDGLDVAALHADGYGDLIAADTGVAGGMFREEGDELVAPGYTFRDGMAPVIARLNLALVEANIVAALFKVGLDAADQFLVGIVAVAEENPEESGRFLSRHLAVLRADPEMADLSQRLIALTTKRCLFRHGNSSSARRCFCFPSHRIAIFVSASSWSRRCSRNR